ncbi:MAG: diguanylate cyclase [Acidimicrobiia bacterium]|nr:diguanylate cyclase [Acidimicrobiia bacterium]
MPVKMALLRSQRNRYVVVALALILVIQLVAVTFSGFVARQSSIAVAEDAIAREGETTIESILRHLDPAEQSVEVTSRLLAGGLVDTSNPGLERYLYTQLSVMPQATGTFVGYPDGSFVFVATEGEGYRTKRIEIGDERTVTVEHFDEAFELTATETLLTDTYDPTIRPWYQLAEEAGVVVWTDPYVFFTSQQPGVTASRAVRVGGEVVAIVGVDVELSGLSEFLDEMVSTKTGEAFVVSGDTVVAAPTRYEEQVWVEDDGSVRLLSMSELGVPEDAAEGDRTLTRVEGDDGTDLVLRQSIPAEQGVDWDVVVRASESEFTGIAAGQQRQMIEIILGTGLFVLLALAILRWVSKPIDSLVHAASTDPLTKVANRREITRRVKQQLGMLEGDQRLAVLALDLDGFKRLNDKFGHERGDRVLVSLAEGLKELTRDRDVVGRLGGDEFVVAMQVNDADQGVAMATRVLDGLRERLEARFPDTDVGVSGGLALSDQDSTEFSALIHEADKALIAAKVESRGMLHLSKRLVEEGVAAAH